MIYKNIASQKIAVFAVDSSGLPKTGDAANITAKISLDGAATATTNDVNPTELSSTDAKGVYLFDMTQAETNANLIVVSIVSATAGVTLRPVIVYTEPDVYARLGAPAGASLAADIVDVAATTVIIYDTVSDVATSQSTIIADTDELQTDWVNGGRLDLLIDLIKAKTDALPSDPADASVVDGAITAAQVAILAKLPAALVGGRIDSSVGSNLDKTGYALTVAGIQAIWDALMSALTLPASVGKLLADNLNATVSSRASQTSVDAIDDFVDTEVSAIKARTDLIPAAPAAVADIPTANQVRDAIFTKTVDGVTFEALGECLMAVLFGKASIAGSVVTFNKRDGTTAKVAVTVGATNGERTLSTIS